MNIWAKYFKKFFLIHIFLSEPLASPFNFTLLKKQPIKQLVGQGNAPILDILLLHARMNFSLLILISSYS